MECNALLFLKTTGMNSETIFLRGISRNLGIVLWVWILPPTIDEKVDRFTEEEEKMLILPLSNYFWYATMVNNCV